MPADSPLRPRRKEQPLDPPPWYLLRHLQPDAPLARSHRGARGCSAHPRSLRQGQLDNGLLSIICDGSLPDVGFHRTFLMRRIAVKSIK